MYNFIVCFMLSNGMIGKCKKVKKGLKYLKIHFKMKLSFKFRGNNLIFFYFSSPRYGN